MSSIEEDIPSYIKDLVTKMDFIGHVPPNRKISVKGKYYMDPDLWSTSALRLYYGENATTTCEYIDRIIRTLTSIITKPRSLNTNVLAFLREKSKVFRRGLVNLIETYDSNPNASSNLRVQLNILDYHLPENVVIGSAINFADDPELMEDE